MLVEEVDMIGPEARQRLVRHASYAVGTAVEPVGWHAIPETELRCNHDLLANRLQRFAHDLLVDARPISLGGVEEGDTALMGRADETDRVAALAGRPITIAQAHAAEANGRHVQRSKFSRFHRHAFLASPTEQRSPLFSRVFCGLYGPRDMRRR